VAQALGVVHILVSAKATKYRLPEQPGQCVPTILATACHDQDRLEGFDSLFKEMLAPEIVYALPEGRFPPFHPKRLYIQ
jgi:hypothetical protein